MKNPEDEEEKKRDGETVVDQIVALNNRAFEIMTKQEFGAY